MPDDPAGDEATSPLRRRRTASADGGATASTTTASRRRPTRAAPAEADAGHPGAVQPMAAPPAGDPPVAAPARWRGWRRLHPAVIAASLIAGLVIGAVAGVSVRRSTPTFQSLAVLNIDQPQAIALSANDGVIAKLSRLRMKYVGLVGTETFAAPVAKTLGLPVGAVEASLRARADPDSLLLIIGATTHTAAMAQREAAEGARYLVDYTQSEQSRNGIPAKLRIEFNLVTPASAPVKVRPTKRREYLTAAGTFVVVTALCLLSAAYVRRRTT